MSVVDTLPFVLPFFGGAVILSWTVTCCMARRTQRVLGILEDRVSLLEARAVAPPAPSAPLPAQAVYTYAAQPVYQTPVAGVYYPPRATAPPVAMSF